MSSLREVKDRIGSVRSTLKITSAMKLVASSKLLKAQRAIENLRPYAEALESMVREARGFTAPEFSPETSASIHPAAPGVISNKVEAGAEKSPVVVLAFSSNSSMCGAFNANAVKKALAVLKGIGRPVEVWAFGRKMADGLRKEGWPAARDYSSLVGKPDFDAIAAVAFDLRQMYDDGRIAGAVMVFNHFVSTGKQVVVEQSFLPVRCQADSSDYQSVSQTASPESAAGKADKQLSDNDSALTDDFIVEPSREEFLESLQPMVSNLKLYAALLDSVASEHAARMIAMQTATDNAQDLLAELTLEYNKGRQQKITSEILDLVSGEAQS